VRVAAFYDHGIIGIEDGPSLVAQALARPEWHRRARCRGTGVTPYFPSRGCNNQAPTRAALRVCWGCPVQLECLEFALGQPGHADHGLWGGTLERQRRRARRRHLSAVELLAELDAKS
jgi:hypothetical protein